MKINLIYITLVQTITIFLLAVGLASQFVYQKFGGEENSSQDPEVIVASFPVPDVVGKMKHLVEEVIEKENEAACDMRSWFADVQSGFVEKCSCVTEDEEVLKIFGFSLTALVGVLTLGLLSYFIYIKTRRVESPTNLQLVDGKWIYVGRKNEDSSTAEPTEAEEGSRLVRFLKNLGSWMASIFFGFIEKMRAWFGEESSKENDVKKSESNRRESSEMKNVKEEPVE